MGSMLLRGTFSHLISGGLLFAAAVFATQQAKFSQWITPLESFYPITIIATALLLGWRFDRSRLVFAAVIITLCALLLEQFTGSHSTLATTVRDAVMVLLPLNLALLAVLKERGIFTWHGLLRWTIIGLQPLAISAMWLLDKHSWLVHLASPLLPSATLADLPLSQPALLALVIALLVTAYRSIGRHNVMEKGLFWALALISYIPFSEQQGATSVLLATALLILVIAVIEISYTMAFRDDLTGLPGRRALNQALLKLGKSYTVAMLDVDHFKKFNDRYGHDVGDQVLRMVAGVMSKVSGGGKAYRYGGEEFTVLFPGKGVEDVLPHLEQLRSEIEHSGFKVRQGKRPRNGAKQKQKKNTKTVQITVSIGAADRVAELKKPDAVIKAADKALYRAKKAGRNRVAH